jgi:hypothetical protein
VDDDTVDQHVPRLGSTAARLTAHALSRQVRVAAPQEIGPEQAREAVTIVGRRRTDLFGDLTLSLCAQYAGIAREAPVV